MADRAAAVGRRDQRHQAADERRGRAAARPTRRAIELPRVARRPEHAVARLHVGAELRRVGLADRIGAGGAQAGDVDRIGGGDVVDEERRAVGRPHARDVLEVLHRERHAAERPEVLAAQQPLLGVARRVERAIGMQRDDRVEGAVVALDPVEAALQHLHRRHVAAADARHQLGQRHVRRKRPHRLISIRVSPSHTSGPTSKERTRTPMTTKNTKLSSFGLRPSGLLLAGLAFLRGHWCSSWSLPRRETRWRHGLDPNARADRGSIPTRRSRATAPSWRCCAIPACADHVDLVIT